MRWRDHVWSPRKYIDAMTDSGGMCLRCGVSYDDLMVNREPRPLRRSIWVCRFRFIPRRKVAPTGETR